MTKKQAQRAAIYIRVSTERQARQYSPAAQRDILTQHAQRMGWECEVFEETGSGASIKGRPVFSDLIDNRLEEFDFLLVIDWDRLGRSEDLGEVSLVKALCREAGVKVATPSQTWDFADEEGEDDFTSDLLAILAKRERKKIVKRTKLGKHRAALEGRWPCGSEPYGYRYNAAAKSLEVVPEEKAVIEQVFDEYVNQGRGAGDIASGLNAAGVPTKRAGFRFDTQSGLHVNSGQWCRAAVRRVLMCRGYIGELIVYKTRRRKIDPSATPLPAPGQEGYQEGTHLPIKCPAMVDRALWERAQELRTARRRLKPGNTLQSYLLSPFAECGLCGRRLGGFTERRRDREVARYRCSGRVNQPKGSSDQRCLFPQQRAEDLERRVIDCIRSWAENDEALAQAANVVRGNMERRTDVEQRVEALEKRLKELDDDRTRIRWAFNKGVYTPEELERDLAAVGKQQDELKRQLEHAHALLRQQEDASRALQQAREVMAVLKRSMDTLDPDGWRRVFEALELQVVVQPDGSFRLRANVPDLERFQERAGADIGQYAPRW